jgi:hypothetical protein
MPRGNIDWVGIQTSYRSGQLPTLGIARQYGVTEGAIRYRAKREGWQRDLTPKYRSGVKEAVLRKQYDSSPPVRKGRKEATEERAEDILAAAIEEGKMVVLKHMALGRLLGDNSRKLGELIQARIENLSAEGEVDPAVLHTLARAHEAITRATANTIQIERQSRGLDDLPPDPTAPPSIRITYYRQDLVLNNNARNDAVAHQVPYPSTSALEMRES